MTKTRFLRSLLVPALLAGVALAPAPVSAQVEPTKQQVLSPLVLVSPPLHLGYHPPGALAQGVMTFLNRTDEMVRIVEVKSSCDCTMAEPSQRLVEPGQTVDVFVGMNINDSLGLVVRDVGIYVEGLDVPIATSVTVEVGYPVRFNKGGRSVGAVGLRGTFTVDSVDGKPFHVLAVNGRKPSFINHDPDRDSAKSEYELFFDWSKLPDDQRPRWVVVETDHPEAEMVEMPMRIQGVRSLQDQRSGWRSIQQRVVLGNITVGEPVETVVTLGAVPLQGGETLTVKSHATNIAVRVVTVGPSKLHKGAVDVVVQLTPTESAEGFLGTILEFEAGGHKCGVDLYARVNAPAEGG